MASDASHLCHHIQVNMNQLQGDVKLDPTEFIAEEDINRLDKRSKAIKVVGCDDKTVKTSNMSIMRQQENRRSDKPQIDWIGPLTLSPTPSLEDEDLHELSMSAEDDQAELKRWHFHLGHLPFN